jgi:beta-phosphoglucomutase-like phosphatase (HAD superfamily)
MIKAILMDFNGVIIDDEPIQMKVYQEILNGEGLDLTEEEYYASMGMDDKTFIENVYNRAGKKPEGNKVLEILQLKTQKWHDAVSSEIRFSTVLKILSEKWLPTISRSESFRWRSAKRSNMFSDAPACAIR